jgi:hypothetical protein
METRLKIPNSEGVKWLVKTGSLIMAISARISEPER